MTAKWHSYAVTFRYDGNVRTWVRFAPNDAHAKRDAIADLAHEYPRGDAELIDVLPCPDPRVKRQFYELENVGTARYTVNMYDGAQTHNDGSPFYGTRIFGNKRAKDRFVRELTRQGYVAK